MFQRLRNLLSRKAPAVPDNFPLPDVPTPPAPVDPTPPAPAPGPLVDPTPDTPLTLQDVWTLVVAEMWSVAKGGGVALAGAVLTWAATVLIPMLQAASPASPGILALCVALSIGVNVARKLLTSIAPAAIKAMTAPPLRPIPPTRIVPPKNTLPLLLVPLLALPAIGCGSNPFETGEPAKAKIQGADKVKLGGMFRLSADGSTGQLQRWTFPPALEGGEYDGGKTLAGVARMVGGAVVTLEVLSIHNGRLERDIATAVVQVEGDAPPAPNPQPLPPAPGPSSALGEVARSQAVALVSSPNRKAEGAKVGGVFRSVAAGVEGGSISTGSAAVGAITSRMDEALGSAAPPWQQWLRAIAPRINDACPEMRDLPRGLRDVAGGVEAVQ